MQVWPQSQELLMAQWLTKVSRACSWWQEPLNSDLLNLEMLSQLRHYLGNCILFFWNRNAPQSLLKRQAISKLQPFSPDTFNSSHSRSGFLLTPLPMGLFLPVSLPVTYSTAFPRGTQVCAFSFLCRHRSSGTYSKIYTSCYITSTPACPVPSVQRKQKCLPSLLITLH